MKKRTMKRWIPGFLSLILLAGTTLTGCSLAKAGEAKAGNDLLAGVYVTVHDDSFEDPVYEALEKAGADGRLYGEFTDPDGDGLLDMVEFDGISGFLCANLTISDTDGTPCKGVLASDEVDEVHVSYNVGDTFNEAEISGTMYYQIPDEQKDMNEPSCFIRINPVYQAADGSVYLVFGDRYALGSAGGTMEISLSETAKTASGNSSTTEACTVHMSFCQKTPCETITILQLSADHEILAEETLKPDALPESLTAAPDAAYAIIEAAYTDENGELQISRSFCERSDEEEQPIFKGKVYRTTGTCFLKPRTIAIDK